MGEGSPPGNWLSIPVGIIQWREQWAPPLLWCRHVHSRSMFPPSAPTEGRTALCGNPKPQKTQIYGDWTGKYGRSLAVATGADLLGSDFLLERTPRPGVRCFIKSHFNQAPGVFHLVTPASPACPLPPLQVHRHPDSWAHPSLALFVDSIISFIWILKSYMCMFVWFAVLTS